MKKIFTSEIINIVDLNTHFFTSNGIVKAVNGMNLRIMAVSYTHLRAHET